MSGFNYFEDLSKIQKSSLMHSAKLFAKKHKDFSKDKLTYEFIDEMLYYRGIGEDKFPGIDFENPKIFKGIRAVMSECAFRAEYEKKNADYIARQKEYAKAQRKRAAAFKRKFEKPTLKQIKYFNSLVKKYNLETPDTTNFSKADYVEKISEILSEHSKKNDEDFSPNLTELNENDLSAANFKKFKQKLTETYKNSDLNFHEAISEIELIVEAVSNLKPKDILTGKCPDEKDLKSIENIVEYRLKTNRPLSQILGFAYFAGEKFNVDENVLTPRPETEFAVEECIRKVPKSPTILDIGTGSGCIAVILAKKIKNAKITACDISDKALEIARKNSEMHGVSDKIKFVKSDVFSNIKGKFDIMVSNPPYIPFGANDVDKNVFDFEPHIALFADENGMFFYRMIIENASKYLKPGGYLIFEAGKGQAHDIAKIMRNNGFEDINIINDLSTERVVSGKLIS